MCLISQEVLRWLIQAVLAIEHMHAHNVLHRDIKPSTSLPPFHSLVRPPAGPTR
jgi:serine/threonine protein kinase